MGQRKDLINTACSQHEKKAVDPKTDQNTFKKLKNKTHTQVNKNTLKHIVEPYRNMVSFTHFSLQPLEPFSDKKTAYIALNVCGCIKHVFLCWTSLFWMINSENTQTLKCDIYLSFLS